MPEIRIKIEDLTASQLWFLTESMREVKEEWGLLPDDNFLLDALTKQLLKLAEEKE